MNRPDPTNPEDEMRPEYDFSGGVRGKHHLKDKTAKMVSLDPDITQAFPDAESVNRALRLLLDLAKNQVRSERVA